MAMKKVGGPAMNEIRSRPTSTRACSGSKRRISTARMPAAPGTSTPLSSPAMCAMGAGMQHGVSRAEVVHPAHQGRLPAQGAVGVQHRLGDAGRAGGEEDECDVGWRRGPGPRPHRCTAQRVGERGGVRQHLGPELEHEGRVDLGERTLDLGRPEGVEDRGRHRAESPARPRQNRGRQAVGHLPRHRRALGGPAFPEAARDGADECIGLGGRQAGVPVDDLAAAGRDEGVERRHVPWSARPAVARGPGSAPRSVGGGPSRQGTLPASQ